MKTASKPTLVVLALLALGRSTFAQELSPREQFQAAVAAYQKEKGATQENALKVISLFKHLDPPPAVPEEAREPFIMGATVLKKASTPTGAAKAVELFTKSLNLAPWFAEAWYNRALARETAGQFGAAIDDLKVYLEFKLADAERREAQDKIYALKADAELASGKAKEEAAKQGKIDQEKAAEAAKFGWILGDWMVDHPAFNGPARSEGMNLVKSGNMIVSSAGTLKVRGTLQAAGEIVWEQKKSIPGIVDGWFALRIDFSGDRKTATLYWPVVARDGSVKYLNEVASKMRRP